MIDSANVNRVFFHAYNIADTSDGQIPIVVGIEIAIWTILAVRFAILFENFAIRFENSWIVWNRKNSHSLLPSHGHGVEL